MTAPLRIGMTCYPTFGGSGIIATELGRELARRGHEVHFICLDAPRRFEPGQAGVFLHEVHPRGYPLFENQYALALTSKMVETAIAARLDLLHVHYAIPHATAAWMATQILGERAPRLVTTLHGTDVTVVGSDPSFQSVTRFSIERSDGVTTPSVFLREATHELLGVPRTKEIDVISNFVDTEAFQPAETRVDRPVIVHNSNFRPLKRMEDVVRVFADVHATRPCELILIGDGPDRPRAESLVVELGLSRWVTFLGERRDFAEVLAAARVFLLTSETESFGLAALEAMSCGVPVVGTNVGGVPEVVEDGTTGYLRPVGDIPGMAEAIRSLLDDDNVHSRMSAHARAAAVDRFRMPPMVDRYEELYRRIVSR